MSYNLSRIMHKAWDLYRKDYSLDFPECLHRAWLCAKAEPINAQRVETAKREAGITEETNTWYGWRQAGQVNTASVKKNWSVLS